MQVKIASVYPRAITFAIDVMDNAWKYKKYATTPSRLRKKCKCSSLVLMLYLR